MDADLDTLVTALYVKVDDELATTSSMPGRPPLLTASELVCLAVMQAMLGVTSERRWLRYVRKNLPGAFAHLPGQAGYNKRLRAALPLIKRVIRMLAADTDFWHDTVWITDSNPGGVRPVPTDRATVTPGRLGRIRLLRLTFAAVLGATAVSGVQPVWDADLVGPGQPQDR